MRALVLIASLLTVTAVAVGCGGGGPMTREDLVDEVNDICADAESATRDVEEPARFDDPAATARYVQQLLPIAREQVGRLRELQPPANLRRRYRAFVATVQRGVRLLGQLRAAALGGQRIRARSVLRRLERATNISRHQAERLGFRECAK